MSIQELDREKQRTAGDIAMRICLWTVLGAGFVVLCVALPLAALRG